MRPDTPYWKLYDKLAPISTMNALIALWQSQEAQALLKAMDECGRAHLIAMKDFYKGMIQRREIDGYHAARLQAHNAKNSGGNPDNGK